MSNNFSVNSFRRFGFETLLFVFDLLWFALISSKNMKEMVVAIPMSTKLGMFDNTNWFDEQLFRGLIFGHQFN